MKKIFLTFVALSLFTPFFVSADSYDGPYCFEKPGDWDSHGVPGEGIRGTCKEVEIKTAVSLDPILQKDYFLGTHAPIFYGCERGCEFQTKYSEQLLLTSSSTLMGSVGGVVDEKPLQYALFGKAYFVPLLSKMFKEQGVVFSESNMPEVDISLFNKSEVDQSKKISPWDPLVVPENAKIDSLNIDKASFPHRYNIHTFNFVEYGKYIYAPKGELAESQYVEIVNGKILSDNDLQIKGVSIGRGGNMLVVPITSPLKSITNYWLYSKKNGKIVLSWQKSEYALDNGQVKVVTATDRNISVALLFSNAFPAPATTPHFIESTSSATSTSGVLPIATEQKVGFIARFFNLILSWFK